MVYLLKFTSYKKINLTGKISDIWIRNLLWGPVNQEVLLKAVLTGPMALSEDVRPSEEAQIRLWVE